MKMILFLAGTSTLSHADLAPQRIAPPPSQRSNPVLLIILLNTVLCRYKTVFKANK